MAARTQRGEQDRELENELLEGEPTDLGDLADEHGKITRDRGVVPLVDEGAEEEDFENDEDEDGDEG